jgi:hypothetical protein
MLNGLPLSDTVTCAAYASQLAAGSKAVMVP